MPPRRDATKKRTINDAADISTRQPKKLRTNGLAPNSSCPKALEPAPLPVCLSVEAGPPVRLPEISTLSSGLLSRLAGQLQLQLWQISNTSKLLHEGYTIPFIARYRKEGTGQLDEVQLRKLQTGVLALQKLEAKRHTVVTTLAKQGVKDADLLKRVREAETVVLLEDLYLPFKPKRSTRASTAVDNGLQPLADALLQAVGSYEQPQDLARRFVGPKVKSVDEALAGAQDIIAQKVSELAEVRQKARTVARQGGLSSKASKSALDAIKARGHAPSDAGKGKAPKKGAASQAKPLAKAAAKAAQNKTATAIDPTTYERYFDFNMRASYLRSHQVLALNRGESLGFLTVKLDWNVDSLGSDCWRALLGPRTGNGPCAAAVNAAISDGLSRSLKRCVDREVRAELTEKAVEEAISTFASNLRSILLAPPMKCGVVLGVDPGFRNGCKMAVCSPTGAVLDTAVIYPHTSGQEGAAAQVFKNLLTKHRVTAVALGDGMASHQTEQFISGILQEYNKSGTSKPGGNAVGWVIVSESGASIYSASPLATQELPELDVTLRGAVSLARRLLDPLAELVKVEPQHLGVGMYQHDIKAALLATELAGVVESAVNSVGVELNTASVALLTHIAGLNSERARNLVEWRDQNGPFKTRQELQKVKGIGPKSFEQAAGFLRLHGAFNALDATSVHPESYHAAVKLVQRVLNGQDGMPSAAEGAKKGKLGEEKGVQGKSSQTSRGGGTCLAWETLKAARPRLQELKDNSAVEQLASLAANLQVGVPTLTDIISSLCCPERDIRGEAPPTILRTGVGSIEDLKAGQEVGGVVRNVVAFGAFVDINVGRDGLIPAAMMRGHTLHPGDRVRVRVGQVEVERKRITLSLITNPA